MNLLSHLSVNALLCQVLKNTENTGFEKPPSPGTLSRGAEKLPLPILRVPLLSCGSPSPQQGWSLLQPLMD